MVVGILRGSSGKALVRGRERASEKEEGLQYRGVVFRCCVVRCGSVRSGGGDGERSVN